jgi:hypothetical protein
MKRTSTYRMTKPLKTSLALGRYKDKEQKDAWKNAMIGAEIHAAGVERHIMGKPGGND